MQGGRQQEGEETNAREAESDAGREGVGEVEKLKEADSEMDVGSRRPEFCYIVK